MKRKLLGITAVCTAMLSLGAASAAQAGVLVKSAGSCPAQALEQPFARWLDPLSYTLVPGGSFETGTPDWKLAGASVASGNETFYVRSRADSRSLAIPAGASAQSATTCVGLDHITLRFFAKSSGSLTGSLLSSLRVEVLTETSLGAVVAVPVGVVTPSSSWNPTLPLPVVANLLPLLPNNLTPIAFRFTAQGPASWRIDDVYVDPHRRG